MTEPRSPERPEEIPVPDRGLYEVPAFVLSTQPPLHDCRWVEDAGDGRILVIPLYP